MSQQELIERPTDGASLVTIIDRLAQMPDLNPDNLDRLIAAQERIMAKQAEIEYNEALAEVQKELPEIRKTATGHNSKYAPYEAIMREFKPVLSRHGFSLDFDTEPAGEVINYVGRLRHRAGHSEIRKLPLPADTSGSKNPIQAMGSTMSYARRYLCGMLLNVVTIGEDDDAATATIETIDESQLADIEALLAELGDKVDRKKFDGWLIKVMKVPNADLSKISKAAYKDVIASLEKKR